MIRLGVDIGGTSVKVAILSDTTEVAHGRSDRYAKPSQAQLAAAVSQALDLALGSAQLSLAPGSPTGLCAPGLFDRATGCITASANLPSLVGRRLDDFLAAASGGRCAAPTICTDAHAAAFDFWSSDLQRRPGRLLALSLGTGVGACVLDDGEPLRVSGSSPGHIGQLDVTLPEDADAPPIGPDGGAGGLEAYVGLRALHAQFDPNFALALSNLAPTARPVRALVKALRITHAIYRPGTIALLGGVGIRLGHVLDAIHAEVSTNLTSVARPGWSLLIGSSDLHAARGAALLACESGPE